MSDLMTMDMFQAVLPVNMKKVVNQELVDQVNATLSDPLMREVYRDNLLSYTNVMSQGKFKIEQYLNAVRYVSFKIAGDTNLAAYTRTFPDKYQNFLAQNVEAKDIASYVSSYNKSKLVNLIYEQTLVPTHILNADLHQKALNVQAELMISAVSEKVRVEAANSLLTHLKRPETNKIELDVSFKEDRTLADLREATVALAAQQRDMIRAGASTVQEVAHSQIVMEGDYEEVE